MLTVVTAATSQDLTALATVKDELGLTDNSQDEKLKRHIHQASAMCAKYCDRVFGSEEVTETFRQTSGQPILSLSRYPVSEISEINLDGEEVDADDYEVDEDSGLLYSLSDDVRGDWGSGKIEVTYTGGYELLSGLPHDIEQACIKLVKALFHGASRDPTVKSEDIPGALSQTFWVGGIGDNGALPPDVTALLDPYRRLGF